ncbi:MAG: hypothetical protein ACREB5_09245 [Sphingomonadaceae bacterium]
MSDITCHAPNAEMGNEMMEEILAEATAEVGALLPPDDEIAMIIVGPHNPVPAASPYTLEQLRKVRWENHCTDAERNQARASAKALKHYFARLIAQAFAQIRRPPARRYDLAEPADGWRAEDSFSDAEKAKLRPIAETLAMLDENAFFGLSGTRRGSDWYEQYLPEAAALYEVNGGDAGAAGLASFVRPPSDS